MGKWTKLGRKFIVNSHTNHFLLQRNETKLREGNGERLWCREEKLQDIFYFLGELGFWLV